MDLTMSDLGLLLNFSLHPLTQFLFKLVAFVRCNQNMPDQHNRQQRKNQIGFHQNWKLLNIKGHHQQSKKQPTEWEKIIVNHTEDVGLVSRIYKELTPTIQQLQKKAIQKLVKDLNRYSPKNISKWLISTQNLCFEKMLIKTNQLENANPNHMEIHTSQSSGWLL